MGYLQFWYNESICVWTSGWIEPTFEPTEKLNRRINEEAKDIAIARIYGNIAQHICNATQLSYVSITCGNNLVTSRINATLYKYITHRKLVHWLSKYSEAPVNLNDINVDWNSFEVARKEAPLGMIFLITKWLRGDTDTGKVILDRKQREH